MEPKIFLATDRDAKAVAERDMASRPLPVIKAVAL